MQHFTISAEVVHRQLINFTPSKSEDAGEILISLACYLPAPLAKLFNNSLETDIIPVERKSLIICPIHKNGYKKDVANNRPICLTSEVCKILERILKANIRQLLKTASLLSDAQHDFVPRRSCLTHLIIAEELVTGVIDQGEPVDVVYLDFSKLSTQCFVAC